MLREAPPFYAAQRFLHPSRSEANSQRFTPFYLAEIRQELALPQAR